MSQRVYWKIRPWMTPGLENSHIKYARRLQALLRGVHSWLDVGCGHDFVPDWAPFTVHNESTPRRIVGIDPDRQALRAHRGLTSGVVGGGEALPFRAGSFELVTANMVLEHVAQPEILFQEVFRVLKPGGTFFGHTPNAPGYTTTLTRLGPPAVRVKLAGVLQGREEHDVYPTFYRANTKGDLARFAGKAGFADTSTEYVESSPLFASFVPLLLPEMVFIRSMRALGVTRLRPCLLITARKPAAAPSRGSRSEER